MASYLRTHLLWKNARVLWRTTPCSMHRTFQQMCRGADLPMSQKVVCRKCFSIVTDSVDPTGDTVTSSAADSPELSSVSARDNQGHYSTESTVKKKFILKKLHSRVLDRAELFSETEALNKVVQDLCEEDSFGMIRRKEENKSKEKKLNRSKVVKGRSGKTFDNVGNTKRFSSFQDRDGVLHDKDNRRETVISEADVFGTLSDEKEDNIELVDSEPVVYRDDEGEVDESEHPYQRLSPIHRRHAPDWYGRQIEKLARDGKTYEAIDMFETTMLKEDRVEPNRYVITVLIGVLGRVGYTKKAFQLFNRMKKFGLEPEDPTYTALFNACSNSPWKEDGLRRAKHLHELMLEKGYQPNTTTSHAMIKAYGMCGDLQRAFVVTDEMLAAGLRPNAETFSFLLMACISDRDAGLKHAIEVWRRMRKKKISPELYQYNLLLRAVRDCGIGSIEFAQQLIRTKPAIDAPRETVRTIDAPREDITIGFPKHDVYMVQGGGEEEIRDTLTTIKTIDVQDVTDEVAEKEKEHKYWWQYENKVKPETQQSPKPALVHSTNEQTPAVLSTVTVNREPTVTGISVFDMTVPNILNPRGKFQNVMSLNDLDTPTKRLALIGGMPGFLSHMSKDGVTPDIRTFTQLLDTIPSSRDAETDLLGAMSVNKVKPDVDFFNMLIRKRNLRKDYSGARDVFSMLSQLSLTPNLHTFGCVAMGCASRSDGLQLLKDMEEFGYEPKVEIFSILIYQSRTNFAYKRALCQEMKCCDVKPNENVLRRIEQSVALAKQMILKKERRQPVAEFYKSSEFARDFRHFMLYYKPWLLSMQLDVPPHPWHAYQVPSGTSEHTQDDADT